MGLYGSPDLSKKYGSPEDIKETKKKRKIIISTQFIVLGLIYLFMVLTDDDKIGLTIAYVGLVSMAYFIINFIQMIIKLFKKKSVNRNVINLIILTGIIAICMIIG